MKVPFGKREILWTDDKISVIWDYYAQNPAYQPQYFSFHSGIYILNEVKKQLSLNKKHILDFGCGPGHLIGYLLDHSRGSMVYGLDFSFTSVRITEEKYKDHPNFDRAVWTERLPSSLNSESMDVVICVEVFEHLSDEKLMATLDEIRRLLKPNGHLVITTPHAENLEVNKTICPECGLIFHRWQHIRSWTPKDIEGWLKLTGFTPILIQPTHFQSFKAELIGQIGRIYKLLTRQKCERTYPHLLVVSKKR